jgi:hypothetical protein
MMQETEFVEISAPMDQFYVDNMGNQVFPIGGGMMINDDGELFGMWPLLDSPLELSVPTGTSVTGLDFPLEELGAAPLSTNSFARRPMRRLSNGVASPQTIAAPLPTVVREGVR